MVMEMLTDLDERLFLKYIEHKSEALLEAIEEGMHAGLFDWEQCSVEPTGVRAYIQDIILSLVSIHCEVRHCTGARALLCMAWPGAGTMFI